MASTQKHACTARLTPRQHLVSAALAWSCLVALMLTAPGVFAQSERGLVLPETALSSGWSQWAPRFGVVMTDPTTRPQTPLSSASPVAGLKIQSAHVLSDYRLGGGFRATVGLVRGATHLPWWQTPDNAMRSGAGLSVQRMDILSAEGLPTSLTSESNRTVPYVGAGYSGQLTDGTGINAWRFQADLGLISLNSSNVANLGRVLNGSQGLEDLIRELRLRPVMKFTINYKF